MKVLNNYSSFFWNQYFYEGFRMEKLYIIKTEQNRNTCTEDNYHINFDDNHDENFVQSRHGL